MRLILNKDIKQIGRAGDVVDVAEGFARNFLIPKKLALIATEAAVEKAAQEKTRRAAKEQEALRSASLTLEKLASKPIIFKVRADEKGHLYAGLKESEILAKLGQGRPPAASHLSLHDYSPLKSLGEHEVNVKISSLNKIRKIKIIIESMT